MSIIQMAILRSKQKKWHLYHGNVNVIGLFEHSESLCSQNNTNFITHYSKLIYNMTYLISTLQ
jgi:hypothetical protein